MRDEKVLHGQEVERPFEDEFVITLKPGQWENGRGETNHADKNVPHLKKGTNMKGDTITIVNGIPLLRDDFKQSLSFLI